MQSWRSAMPVGSQEWSFLVVSRYLWLYGGNQGLGNRACSRKSSNEAPDDGELTAELTRPFLRPA
jgi:hypothetical protein